MEEILASIRRIIADDDATKTAKAPEPPPPPKPAPPPAAAPKPAPPPPPPPRAPAPPPKPAAATNNQEEIDAMLADLDVAPKVPPKPAPPPAPPMPDVLDLTEAMAAPPPPPPPVPAAPPAPSFRTIDAASDVVFTDRAPPPPPAPPSPPPAAAVAPALMSNATMAAVDSAFNTLAHTVLGNNARTLEDLVKEMLRPMLKSWLDDNLPGMVDRIVRAEIERVARGR